VHAQKQKISNVKNLLYISVKFESFVFRYVKFIKRHSGEKRNVMRKIFQTVKIKFGEILGPIILFPKIKIQCHRYLYRRNKKASSSTLLVMLLQ